MPEDDELTPGSANLQGEVLTTQWSVMTQTATAKTGSEFATQHFHAAVKAARNAREIEAAHWGEAHGPWFMEMLHTVPVAIVMASAAIEAYVNELTKIFIEKPDINETQKNSLQKLFDKTSSNAPKRLNRLFCILGEDFDSVTRSHILELNILIKLRNGYMHFRPKWSDEPNPTWNHSNNEEDAVNYFNELKSRVRVYGRYADSHEFPYGFSTYSTAKWAIETALGLAAHISQRLGVPNKFAEQDYALLDDIA